MKTAFLWVIVVCETSLLFQGCVTGDASPALHRYEFQGQHMGTMFTIKLYATNELKAREASDAAFAQIAALDRTMTDYDPESELMQLCRKPTGVPVRVSDDLFDVLQRSQRVSAMTDGAFDATIGPVVRLWRRVRRAEVLPDSNQLAHAHEAVGWQKFKLDAKNKTATLTSSNMQLDLGGIAKGYAADKALEVLKHLGCPRALVAASGDIAVGDPPPGENGWRVSIETPGVRELLLCNAAVSTSGDAEQFVEIGEVRYSHIVDPRTGLGITNHLQVSIIGRRATDTDGFATAVCVLGTEQGMRLVESQPGMAAIITLKSGATNEVFESDRARRFLAVKPTLETNPNLPLK